MENVVRFTKNASYIVKHCFTDSVRVKCIRGFQAGEKVTLNALLAFLILSQIYKIHNYDKESKKILLDHCKNQEILVFNSLLSIFLKCMLLSTMYIIMRFLS